MKSKNEIKADLLAALDEVGDETFAQLGFKRRKGSLNYTREINDTRHTIAFAADYLPKYQADAEVHLHPAMHLGMNAVSEAALKLVGGNKILLANAPEVIINQPIEFTAPKAKHVRWFASGLAQMKERVSEIAIFVEKWVIPFFDDLKTPDDLVSVYKNVDERMIKQRHWYLFVAAAVLVNGNRNEALSVLEDNLGAPALRKRYALAFEALSC
jgi:hypothetical protein